VNWVECEFGVAIFVDTAAALCPALKSPPDNPLGLCGRLYHQQLMRFDIVFPGQSLGKLWQADAIFLNDASHKFFEGCGVAAF
jgi:hypothetical protein